LSNFEKNEVVLLLLHAYLIKTRNWTTPLHLPLVYIQPRTAFKAQGLTPSGCGVTTHYMHPHKPQSSKLLRQDYPCRLTVSAHLIKTRNWTTPLHRPLVHIQPLLAFKAQGLTPSGCGVTTHYASKQTTIFKIASRLPTSPFHLYPFDQNKASGDATLPTLLYRYNHNWHSKLRVL
jgi:hypothetical protein